jgi:hypothetical protein
LSLAQRVVFAVSMSAVVVMILHGLMFRKVIEAEATRWELEQLGVVAHHVAEVVSRDTSPDYRAIIATIAEAHRPFGHDIEWIPSGSPGPGQSAVTVALEGVPGLVRVTATSPLFYTLDRRIVAGYVVLAGVTVFALFAAVFSSVHWGLVQPLKSVRYQLRLMRKGPWAVSASAIGSREILELATDLEAVGHSLDRSITTWIEAERRATLEATILDLRNRLVPPARELNLITTDLLAREILDSCGVNHLRRLLVAVDAIMDTVRPFDDVEEA